MEQFEQWTFILFQIVVLLVNMDDRVDDAVHTGSRHHRENARDHEKDHRRFEMARHCLGNQGDGNGGKKVLHQNAVVECPKRPMIWALQ